MLKLKDINPNVEIRNSKQIQNANVQNFKQLFWVIWVLIINICFKIRASDFVFEGTVQECAFFVIFPNAETPTL